MYAVTGASGQLGRLVIEALIAKADPASILALVRDPAKLDDLARQGVVVRAFDYKAQEALKPALAGVDRLLLISSNDLGQREAQHGAVIAAAKAASVGFIAYTSILHADSSPLGLAAEHRATEAAIKASGLAYALLRNGWYTENYTISAHSEIAHGGVMGSTGEGRISAATRADYAAGAAAILTRAVEGNRTYELAGDEGFTLSQYAAALAQVSGKPVAYTDLPEDAYRDALEGLGLPGPLAAMLADSSAKAAGGALFDQSLTLSALIGRPTTSMIEAVKAAVAA
jgi:NAD(P)H dehydrogenase (quinone)